MEWAMNQTTPSTNEKYIQNCEYTHTHTHTHTYVYLKKIINEWKNEWMKEVKKERKQIRMYGKRYLLNVVRNCNVDEFGKFILFDPRVSTQARSTAIGFLVMGWWPQYLSVHLHKHTFARPVVHKVEITLDSNLNWCTHLIWLNSVYNEQQ